jgi:hypothetical protein
MCFSLLFNDFGIVLAALPLLLSRARYCAAIPGRPGNGSDTISASGDIKGIDERGGR